MAISKIITSSLTDDAVTSAKIGTDQVGADALSSSAISGAVDIPANSVGESELSVDYTAQSVPHIIPGVLQPAIAGKLLNGADHSGAYGTPQTQSGGDGHSYYYTDIKGSKPIKDPRIGGHFGSQRHKFKSLQLLEQETATHGDEVYSIDGREWVRGVKGVNAAVVPNDDSGNRIRVYGFVEIVGYFIDVNLIIGTHTADREFNTSVDGGSASSANTLFQTSSTSPLGSRYVDIGSVGNLGLGLSLGIHTLKVTPQAQSENINFYGIELIAQDTTSTANRSKIQIPSQNVVSFGKKFNVSGTPHYDPFTTMSYGGSGTTLSALQSLIDTDTSLGMDAWKAGTSNYHRPWNGGRVVKWVDSSGTIKTSVNMMPPNAQNIDTTASNAVSDAHVIAGTNDDTINFNTSAIDHSQAEVAKTFYFREFGNGSANGGTNSSNYADASMLSNTKDDIAYVIDDGFTSLNSASLVVNAPPIAYINDAGNASFFTFIGTGFTFTGRNPSNVETAPIAVVQNLPYGTHIVRIGSNSGNHIQTEIKVDGVEVYAAASGLAEYGGIVTLTIGQPKRPPIPEDACVLADYMLMADYVPQTDAGNPYISKGVLSKHNSRDIFYDAPSGSTSGVSINHDYHKLMSPYAYAGNASGTITQKIPYFGTSFTNRFNTRSTYTITTGTTHTINGSDLSSYTLTKGGTGASSVTSAGVLTKTAGDHESNFLNANGGTLGNNILSITETGVSNKYAYFGNIDVATPIHTSSHYQPFETPFLHELVGGDRNMEQHNLVVSPDGKTWDEVTRDTSYIGNIRCTIGKVVSNQGQLNPIIWDNFRGRKTSDQHEDFMTKDFAIAYDRIICLVDGQYQIHYWTYVNSNTTAGEHRIKVNGQWINYNYTASMNTNSIDCLTRYHLKRGDYIQVQGSIISTMGGFQITKV